MVIVGARIHAELSNIHGAPELYGSSFISGFINQAWIISFVNTETNYHFVSLEFFYTVNILILKSYDHVKPTWNWKMTSYFAPLKFNFRRISYFSSCDRKTNLVMSLKKNRFRAELMLRIKRRLISFAAPGISDIASLRRININFLAKFN